MKFVEMPLGNVLRSVGCSIELASSIKHSRLFIQLLLIVLAMHDITQHGKVLFGIRLQGVPLLAH